MPTADRTCATVLERGNGWVLAMLVPPVEAGVPARGCAPAALPRGAVAPPCAPWLSSSVGARSAPTNRHARSPRGVEQGAAFWFARLKNVRLVAARCTVILTCQGRPHKGLAGPGRDKLNSSDYKDFRRLLRASCISPARPASRHRRMLSNESRVRFKQTAAYEHVPNILKKTVNKKHPERGGAKRPAMPVPTPPRQPALRHLVARSAGAVRRGSARRESASPEGAAPRPSRSG